MKEKPQVNRNTTKEQKGIGVPTWRQYKLKVAGRNTNKKVLLPILL